MASTDAKPIPIKNTAYRVLFPILDNDGDLVVGAVINSGLVSGSGKAMISVDQATPVNTTNNVTEVGAAQNFGQYYLDLTSGEMNGDAIQITIRTTTTDAKNTAITIYPQEATDILVGLQDDAISDAKYDESTAFPIKSADLTTTKIVRAGDLPDHFGDLLIEETSGKITIIDGGITEDTYDNSTAFPVASVDDSTTKIVRAGDLPTNFGDLSIEVTSGKVELKDGSISADTFDNSTAFPLAKIDESDTELLRTEDLPDIGGASFDALVVDHLDAGTFGLLLAMLTDCGMMKPLTVYATAEIVAQGITIGMANTGRCVQYIEVKFSSVMDWGTPDFTKYIVYRYDADHHYIEKKWLDTSTWA